LATLAQAIDRLPDVRAVYRFVFNEMRELWISGEKGKVLCSAPVEVYQVWRLKSQVVGASRRETKVFCLHLPDLIIYLLQYFYSEIHF
jgi:hypothetical protein